MLTESKRKELLKMWQERAERLEDCAAAHMNKGDEESAAILTAMVDTVRLQLAELAHK